MKNTAVNTIRNAANIALDNVLVCFYAGKNQNSLINAIAEYFKNVVEYNMVSIKRDLFDIFDKFIDFTDADEDLIEDIITEIIQAF